MPSAAKGGTHTCNPASPTETAASPARAVTAVPRDALTSDSVSAPCPCLPRTLVNQECLCGPLCLEGNYAFLRFQQFFNNFSQIQNSEHKCPTKRQEATPPMERHIRHGFPKDTGVLRLRSQDSFYDGRPSQEWRRWEVRVWQEPMEGKVRSNHPGSLQTDTRGSNRARRCFGGPPRSQGSRATEVRTEDRVAQTNACSLGNLLPALGGFTGFPDSVRWSCPGPLPEPASLPDLFPFPLFQCFICKPIYISAKSQSVVKYALWTTVLHQQCRSTNSDPSESKCLIPPSPQPAHPNTPRHTLTLFFLLSQFPHSIDCLKNKNLMVSISCLLQPRPGFLLPLGLRWYH